MSDSKPPSPESADWTHLLTDPDLVSHLGKLLKTYREAPPEQREQALLEAMREIKSGQANKTSAGSPSRPTSHPAPTPATAPTNVSPAMAAAAVAPAPDPPPFEPDIFTPNWGQ